MTTERLFWQLRPRGSEEAVSLEHHGVGIEQAAAHLISVGAIPSKPCACCGQAVPLDGTQVRFVRLFGEWQDTPDDPIVQRQWVHATEVAEPWRTYPLSRKGGGN